MTERKYRTKQEILKSFAGVSEPTAVMVFLEVLIDIRDILDNRMALIKEWRDSVLTYTNTCAKIGT